MTTSSQTPTGQRFADLAPLSEALSALIAEFAELPRPYVVLHTTLTGIGLQLSDPAEFELWREALALPPGEVDLAVTPAMAWLHVSGRYRGVAFDLTGHGVLVSVEQSLAPRGVEAVAA